MSIHDLSNTVTTALSLHTPLLDLLGCEYPILCAGMGGVARAELAAAVSEAGGFGCMGMVRESPQFIRAQVTQYRALSHKPFAVNIVPAATAPALLEQQVATLIEMKVAAVCLFWDVMPEVVQRFKGVGITVIHQVGSVADAHRALAAGVDILIVQGVEAGGHVWANQSIYTLLPEICRFSAVPVIAAGGIATGQAIVAAMMLGAQGVSCGSAFLATFESNAHSYHKQRVIDAKADDTLYTTTFHINWPDDAPVRVLRNSVTETSTPEQCRSEERVKIGEQDGQDVFLFATDSPLKGATGELEKMALYAGRSCGDIHGLCSAADRLQQLVMEARVSMQRIANPEDFAFTDHEMSSSPCMASEFNGDYSGHCSDEELFAFIVESLETENAIARVCGFSMGQAGNSRRHDLLLKIHFEGTKNCDGLEQCIEILGKQAGDAVGGEFEECMAIQGFIPRMQYIRNGQDEVLQKISEILPRVGNSRIFDELKSLRARHKIIIGLFDQLLQ
tara:strand:- start:4548 stop:6062 length:1515 start_codon:yes stop_codon:yes gene_type:complete